MDSFVSRILERSRIIKDKYDELTELIAFPEIVADGRYWRKLVSERNSIEEIAQKYAALETAVSDKARFESESASTNDDETKNMLAILMTDCETNAELLTQELNSLLLKNEFDYTDAVLDVKAVDGGDAGTRLAHDIFTMYENYAKTEKLGFKITEKSNAGQNKLKFASAVVSGFGAYAKLKYENGGHKTAGAGNAGTVTVAVFPQFKEESSAGVLNEKDIRTDIFHSGGPGGQNVNKVESAVRLTHLPTGITVICRNERSQLQNRAAAMKALETKIREYYDARKREAVSAARKESSSAAKSGKIRTYNYQLNNVTDQRTGVTLDAEKVFGGEISEFIDAAVLMYGKNI